MRDSLFVRGKVPMTKSEVRAVSLSKLELEKTSVVYDVGAGTGSVSVEAALEAKDGHVYAIEKNPEAQALIFANREAFSCSNMTVVPGNAATVMEGLPAPTHAFIGGSSGELEEIVDQLLLKNSAVRVVINVIALESLTGVFELLRSRSIEAEIVSLQVARAEKKGSYHLMRGENPVYVIAFGGKGTKDEN